MNNDTVAMTTPEQPGPYMPLDRLSTVGESVRRTGDVQGAVALRTKGAVPFGTKGVAISDAFPGTSAWSPPI